MAIGKNGVDWEGMSMTDHDRYIKIRRVLEEELDDNLMNMGDEEIQYSYNDESTVLGSVELEMLKSNLMEILSTLTEREAKILDMRFGLTDREYTLEEVSHVFDVTKNRIRQLEFKALMKMRNPSRSYVFREYYSEMI